MSPANMAKSVHQRLLNLRDETGEPFDRLLIRYGLERLLYRLQMAGYGDDFVLKGAILFSLWQRMPGRPTRDLDLLGYGSAAHEDLRKIFIHVCEVNVVDDGLTFDTSSIKIEDIREEEEYQGLRVRMTAYLDRARIPVQIDIGYGDAVTPMPEVVEYPALLDFPPPSVLIYHPATVVAEKFNAMVVLGIVNSRLKDFYDLYTILTMMNISDRQLITSIKSTFSRRNVKMPSEMPFVFAPEFLRGGHKETEWQTFLKRSQLTDCDLSFAEVVQYLRERLWPLIEEINRGE